MAVSLLLMLSRRLQAPVAALIVLGGLQLASAVLYGDPTAPTRTALSVRGALASPTLAASAQIAPERS